jgi:zinc transporter 5/7
MFVEIFFGLISNCLGLLTDGAHMFLDCSAVIIGLYSSYLTEFPSNPKYQFGFLRSEVLGTFINSVFLIFIAIYIIFESIERFISPKDIHSEHLILVSFLGLIVNIIGLFMVHDHGDDDDNENNEKSNSDDLINNENNNEILNINEHSDNDYIEEITYDEGNLKEKLEKKNEESKIKEKKINNIQHKHNNIENNENEINNESHIEIHNHNQHHHHHQNDNIYAIYIHILADTLGSIAVLISSYLIRFHDIKISDPICSCLISILIVYSTIPVLKNSAVILLHIPNSAIKIRKEKIKKKCDEYNDSGFIIQSIDLWMLKKNNFVCDIKIIKNNNIADNGNKKLLYKDLSRLMKELKIKEFFIDI